MEHTVRAYDEARDLDHVVRIWLEIGWIDSVEEQLEPLTSFVLPGGTKAAAAFHVARTVCRRAERGCVALGRDCDLDPGVVGYLNRLSDLLFTLARVENHRAGVRDVEWEGRRERRAAKG